LLFGLFSFKEINGHIHQLWSDEESGGHLQTQSDKAVDQHLREKNPKVLILSVPNPPYSSKNLFVVITQKHFVLKLLVVMMMVQCARVAQAH